MKKVMGIFVFMCLIGLPAMASGGESHGFDWIQFIAKVVNTVIFFGVLYHFLKSPVKDFFSRRLAGIKASLELAERSREESKKRLDEIEEKMRHLDDDLAEIERQARLDADAEKRRIQAKAEKEADRIRTQAEAEISHFKRQAIQDLRTYVSEVALKEAEAALSAAMTDKERARVFQEFVDKVGAKL